MIRFACAVGFGSAALLAAAFLVSTKARGCDEKAIAEARKDVLELARLAEQGKDVKAKAEAIRKKYEDLEPIVKAYSDTRKGGIGFGKARAPGDGIERKIVQLNKRALPLATLEKEKDDLIRMGYVSVAMAEIIIRFTPTGPRQANIVAPWRKESEAMNAAALDLISAAKASDPTRLKAAATKLNNSCCNCHSCFQ